MKKHTVIYVRPEFNPFKTYPKDAPARSKDSFKERQQSGYSSGGTSYQSGGYQSSGFRGGRGGYNNNRGGGGGMNNVNGTGMNMSAGGFSNQSRGGGFQTPQMGMMGGYNAMNPMNGMGMTAGMGGFNPQMGFIRGGGMMGANRGVYQGNRGRGGMMGNMGMMPQMGMPNMASMPNMGAMGMGMGMNGNAVSPIKLGTRVDTIAAGFGATPPQAHFNPQFYGGSASPQSMSPAGNPHGSKRPRPE